MDETANNVRIPVNVLYLGPKEYIIACAAIGGLIGLSYQIGREVQRHWVDKHMIVVPKKV